MAYTKQYSKTTWVNNEAPPINASNLNKIEEGIDNVDSGLVEVSADVVAEATVRANADTAINGKIGDLTTLETEDKSTLVGAINENTEALETKAEIDGYYEDMTVGDAEQLVATQYVEDAVPYKFRTTGGSADVGNREYVEAVVGGTIAWNQLVSNKTFSTTHSENGVTITWQDELTVRISGTASSVSWIWAGLPAGFVANNHIYLFTTDNKPNGVRFGLLDGTGSMTNTNNDTITYALLKNINDI